MAAQTSADYDPLDDLRREYFEAGAASERRQNDREEREQRNRDRRTETGARRAETDAAKEARLQAAAQPDDEDYAPELSAPNLSTPGVGSLGIGSGGPDRATSARIIVVIVAISAVGTVAHDAIVGSSPSKTTVKVGNGTVTVPTHLRTLGAVLVMGTIALIVNEVDPGIGLLLGVALGLDVAVNTLTGSTGLFGRLQSGIFATSATKKTTVPSSWAMPSNGTVPTPYGFNIPGPQGVGGPQQVWNGKGWVPVTSTKTN